MSNLPIIDIEEMSDLTAEDASALSNYYEALNKGEYANAARIASTSGLNTKLFTVAKWNDLIQAIRTTQEFYNSDIQTYIANLEASLEDVGRIDDNQVSENTLYSSSKIESIIADYKNYYQIIDTTNPQLQIPGNATGETIVNLTLGDLHDYGFVGTMSSGDLVTLYFGAHDVGTQAHPEILSQNSFNLAAVRGVYCESCNATAEEQNAIIITAPRPIGYGYNININSIDVIKGVELT